MASVAMDLIDLSGFILSQVVRSAVSGMATLNFGVIPLSGASLATIAPILTSTTAPLSLTTSAASSISLYIASDPAPPTIVSLPVVQVTVLNAELYSSIPLNAADAATLDSKMQAYVQGKTGLGSNVLASYASVCSRSFPDHMPVLCQCITQVHFCC
jgi:hypothetical protein